MRRRPFTRESLRQTAPLVLANIGNASEGSTSGPENPQRLNAGFSDYAHALHSPESRSHAPLRRSHAQTGSLYGQCGNPREAVPSHRVESARWPKAECPRLKYDTTKPASPNQCSTHADRGHHSRLRPPASRPRPDPAGCRAAFLPAGY